MPHTSQSILIDGQFLQNVIFSFEKGFSDHQIPKNHLAKFPIYLNAISLENPVFHDEQTKEDLYFINSLKMNKIKIFKGF